MHVPLAVPDFIERAALAYGARVGVVDEPERADRPGPRATSIGSPTYREVAGLAARQAAKLDELGIGFGERVGGRQSQ